MIIFAVLLFLLASQVHAATYYVATTGSDSNNGSSESPWRNPQKCAKSPVVAGDTCLIAAGSYTAASAGHTRFVILIDSSLQGSPAGTTSNPITIRGVTGTKLIQPSVSGTGAYAIYVNQPYYVFENIEIDGSTTTYGTGLSTGHHGVSVQSSNITVRGLYIHHIGRTQCSNSANSSSGMSLNDNRTNILIERTRFESIGRLRNGESGCTTDKFHHDHGIYAAGADNVTIRNNQFVDNGRGFAITLFKSGATLSDYKIHNNTFVGVTGMSLPAPNAQLNLSSNLVNVSVQNNIFYEPSQNYGIGWGSTTTASNVVISHNLTNTGTLINPSGQPGSGITSSNNTVSTSPGFTNAGSADYTLAAGSAAINAGTAVAGATCVGVCDKGAFETFGPVAASITASLLDVTYNTAFGPIQPSGATGHSIGCSPTCGTITVANASLFSSADSIVRYTASGFSGGNCVDTQTITKSFNASTGTLTDSINIGGTLNQPVHSYGPIAVTNQCDGGGSPTPPGSPHRLYELDGNGNDTSGNAGHATVSGGSFVAGKYGQALQGTDGTAVSATSDYGSGVNPSTQDLTIIFGYEVPAGATGLTRTVAGSSIGTDQRLHISAQSGTWQIAIGDSSTSSGTPSNLPVVEGYNRLCLRLDSTANVATLTANNVTGTGGATKVIPNYTLASNIAFGLPSGFNAVVAGGGKWDKAVIYTSLVSCNDDWLAWEPPSSPPVGTYAQTGARWLRVMGDGSAGPVLYSEASTINVVQGGAVIYQSRTACSGANCSAIGEKVWYTLNGGTAQEVPNSFTSTGVAFWGANTSAHMYLGAASWSPSANGTTQTTNVAQPTIELAQDASIVRNSVLRFASDATGTYCFHERDQNGNELDSVPTACVVVIPPQANGAH